MAAWRDGVVSELEQQLDEARREAADLRVRVTLGTTGPPGRSFADIVAGRQDGAPLALYPGGPPGSRGPPPGFPGDAANHVPGPADAPAFVAFVTPV
ncbi:hypothetical protein MTO96_041695, partial [Rhipicephalus appendiculatus]